MDNKSLIALVSEAAGLEQALIESGGEITPKIEAMLEVKDLHLPEKVDNYALIMERMKIVATFYKWQSDQYLRLSNSASSVVERCEYNLKTAMVGTEASEIVGNNYKYRLVQNNPRCMIDDEKLVSGAYKTIETKETIDKKRLIEDLKIGPVAGAHLERGVSLRRYLNSPNKKADSK